MNLSSGEMKLVGGYGIEKNVMDASKLFECAANQALMAGKGKLAAQFFERAENTALLAESPDLQ